MSWSGPALFVLRSGSAARPDIRVAVAGWAADRLDRDLACGPAATLAMIAGLEPLGADRWPREELLAGGLAVDATARRVVFFGGDAAIRRDLRVRSVRIELLRRVWAGWDLRYAIGGVAELADCAGRPLESVLSPVTDLALDPPGPPWFVGPVDSVVVLRDPEQALELRAVSWDPVELALAGPGLVDRIRAEPPASDALELGTPPRGGLSIDLASQTLDVWLAEPLADAASRIARRWPGFAVRYSGDDPTLQRSFAAGRLSIDAVDPRATARAFLARAVGVAAQELDALFEEVRERLAADRPLAVDPRATPGQLTRRERAWILGAALDQSPSSDRLG